MEMNSNQPVNPSVTPAENSVLEHLEKNQKGNFPIILGILVLLLIVGGGAYYLGTQRNQITSKNQQSVTAPATQPNQNSQPSLEQAGSFDKSQIVFEKDIPSSNKKLIVFNTNNNVEGFDSELYVTDSNYDKQSAIKAEVKLVSIANYEAFVPPSQNKSYVVLNTNLGDGQEFYIIDSNGNLISGGVVEENYKTIGYGIKFGCQCGTSFKSWNDDAHFTLKILNGNGEEYEIMVDATTGKANEASFRKIK